MDTPLTFLKQLTPLTKSDYRRHFPSGVLTRKPNDDWQYISTSGTTDRLSVVADFTKRDHRRSSELRALATAVGQPVGLKTVEIPPNACNVICGLDNTVTKSFGKLLWQSLKERTFFQQRTLTNIRGQFEREILLRKETLPPLDALPMPELIQALDAMLLRIQRTRPVVLRGFPLYLLWLAERAQMTNTIIPSLRFVLPYGGLATLAMIKRIENGLSAVFRNVYGTSELGPIAASCGQGLGMHLFEDLFIVDAMPLSSSTAHPICKLVVTDLINTAMPMIRYEVGDVGELHSGRCLCGRTTQRLSVYGRTQETLCLRDRNIPASQVADTFFVDEHIWNGRLDEVTPGCFEASLVAAPTGEPDFSAWEKRFRSLINGHLKQIRVKKVSYLQPETSGKYRFVWPYLPSILDGS